jgi:hypothetical protein
MRITLPIMAVTLAFLAPRLRVRDEYYAVNRTHAAQVTLADMVRGLDRKGIDVCGCASVDELLEPADKTWEQVS